MPLIPDPEAIQDCLSALPLTKFKPGEVVLLAGSRSEQLLFLKKGTVAVVKDGIEITRVTESGAVFGELSVLLNQPHTADVRAVEPSQFYVANADILAQEPTILLYVAAILGRRLNATNRVFVELKTQLKSGQRGGLVEKTMEKMEGLVGGVLRLPTQSLESGGGLVGRAEAFLAAHPNAEAHLRRIFALKLANLRTGEENTRRRAPRSSLPTRNGEPSKSWPNIPTVFSLRRDAQGRETYVEVANEVIFRRWRKLSDWITAEREFLTWKTGLEAARRGWKDTSDSAKSGALLKGKPGRGPEAGVRSAAGALPAADLEFIDQSTQQESKAKARASGTSALSPTRRWAASLSWPSPG